jgi:hypothetical protein
MSIATYSPSSDLQTPYEVAVVIPTALRPSLLQAVRSVFAQDLPGRVQVLIGIDKQLGSTEILDTLRSECPPRMALTVVNPGYSTANRNGGLYSAIGGGALRTVMSHLANSPYIAYLDDDNWWAADHLSSLRKTIEGVGWAWSYRWLVDAANDKPIAIDKWDSVGPGRGLFRRYIGGFVDTNCLMLDKRRADDVLWYWSHGMLRRGAASDRRVFRALVEREPWRCSEKATAYYRVEFDRQQELARRIQNPPPKPPPVPRVPLPQLMQLLHPVSPYAGPWPREQRIEEPKAHRGMMELFRRVKPRAVVDICDGDTTAAFQLARAATSMVPQALTIAVESWLPRLTLSRLRTALQERKPIEPYGASFEAFRHAALSADLGRNLLPLPQEPFDAARLLREANTTIDILRVPWRDDETLWHAWLRAFWPTLRKGGVAIVEFYTPELFLTLRGIEIFASERGLKVGTIGPEEEKLLYVVKTEAQPEPAKA